MKAWQVQEHGEPRDALRLVDVPLPEPEPGTLRLRVAATGLGLPDLLMCRGTYPLTPARPFSPGQELVGTVTAVGDGCHARPGERVMAVSAFTTRHGGFAEEALAFDHFAFPADPLTDAEAAGFLIPYHTAWIGLAQRGRLARGETLLVLGAAGSSGSAATLLGKALGARVIATAGGPEKVAFCKELGADEVIDYRSQNITEAVRALTDGRGAQVVYDPVGGDAFSAATRCIAHEGRLLVVGFASGDWGRVSTPHLTQYNYSVLGVMPSGYDRAFKSGVQKQLMELYRSGAIRVPVGQVFPFEQLPDALAELASGRVMGKLVLAGPRAG
jgi:NADPH2:quinone reductase